MEVQEYLSEYEMKNIATEMFKDFCRAKLTNDWERIISNAAYDTASKIVQESIGESMDSLIAEKAKVLIEGLTTYTVFKAPDVWDREASRSYNVLVDCVASEKGAIKTKVQQAIKNISKKEALDIIKSKEIKFI